MVEFHFSFGRKKIIFSVFRAYVLLVVANHFLRMRVSVCCVLSVCSNAVINLPHYQTQCAGTHYV